MSRRRRGRQRSPESRPDAPPQSESEPLDAPASALPRGRIPAIGMREIVAALHRRRERRRESAAELTNALQHLKSSVEVHLTRIGAVRAAIEAQGGDLSHLQHYDSVMARLRAELRTAERSLAQAFGEAARA